MLQVWYACYGSNLSRERFMCYIKGGRPEFSQQLYEGCTDPSPPLREEPYSIPHRIYFGEKSSIWENKGVAFIYPGSDPDQKTRSRRYLITSDQFIQITRQENGRDPTDRTFSIDLQMCQERGHMKVGTSWYSMVLYLGVEDDIPIFTFTSPEIRKENQPGENYLNTIRNGLRETYPGMKEDEVNRYLKVAQGT